MHKIRVEYLCSIFIITNSIYFSLSQWWMVNPRKKNRSKNREPFAGKNSAPLNFFLIHLAHAKISTSQHSTSLWILFATVSGCNYLHRCWGNISCLSFRFNLLLLSESLCSLIPPHETRRVNVLRIALKLHYSFFSIQSQFYSYDYWSLCLGQLIQTSHAI